MVSSILVTNTMDSVYENSISAIEVLQTRFGDQSNVMVLISRIGDPRYAFTFYFPLLFALDWVVGQRLLLVAVVVEWLNQILKWVMYGDRPYWWVHETHIYNSTMTPLVQQYYVTCETGPGCPSGHAMVMSAIWYTMISAFINKIIRNSSLSNAIKAVTEQVLWWCYVAFILAIILSRVYLATHFPHQCFLGAFIGLYIASIMNKMDFESLRLNHYIMATGIIVLCALGTYWLLMVTGNDPLWSVDRALKWCIKKEYIHIDTTPFFSMVRYCGAILGLGLGITSSLNDQASRKYFNTSMRVKAVALSMIAARSLDLVVSTLPKDQIYVFYVQSFFLNVALPFVITAIVPYTVVKLSGSKAVDSKFKKY